jgi:pyridoxamine 5'-phosphate oxidase family protein
VVFTDAEFAYLVAHPLGRLSTIGPDGAPQVQPVAFQVNESSETIDIGGPDLATSQKFRNIGSDPRVSFVVDDVAEQAVGPGGQRGRGVEMRGHAQLLDVDRPLMDGFSRELIRVHPRRVIAWNLDGPGYNTRNVSAGPHGATNRRRARRSPSPTDPRSE